MKIRSSWSPVSSIALSNEQIGVIKMRRETFLLIRYIDGYRAVACLLWPEGDDRTGACASTTACSGPTPAPRPAPAPSPTPAAEKPKYGGTFNAIRAVDTPVFDTVTIPRGLGDAAMIIYEHLIDSDWSKGKAGSGVVDWGDARRMEGFGPYLAESWEMPEVGTYVMQIRRGVHFALNPASEASRLVNGRELTADNVVWSVNYNTKTPTSSIRLNQPATATAATAEKTVPWTVVLKTPVDPMSGFWWIAMGGNSQHIWAREVAEKYGNTQDWHNVVGTGARMITDFVAGSIATLQRNPNYWGKDLWVQARETSYHTLTQLNF